jgi:hypothetical protein
MTTAADERRSSRSEMEDITSMTFFFLKIFGKKKLKTNKQGNEFVIKRWRHIYTHTYIYRYTIHVYVYITQGTSASDLDWVSLETTSAYIYTISIYMYVYA